MDETKLGPFPQQPQQPPIQLVRGAELCAPGQAWSCKIACDSGTRFPIERIFGNTGIEVCAVVGSCTCEQLPPDIRTGAQAASVQDIGLPIVTVLWGLHHILKR